MYPFSVPRGNKPSWQTALAPHRHAAPRRAANPVSLVSGVIEVALWITEKFHRSFGKQ